MYYGKMTKELKKLYKQYYEKFGVYPDFYDNADFGDATYDRYVYLLKWALREGKELTNLYPPIDGEW